MMGLPESMRGAWRRTPEAIAADRARLDELARLGAEARASRQLAFDFEAEAEACELCGGDGELDCARCEGQGCNACDGHGRVDCDCEGGPPELDDDDDADP